MDKATLSKTRRKKSWAPDDRISSTVLGMSVIVVTLLPVLAFLVIADWETFYSPMISALKNVLVKLVWPNPQPKLALKTKIDLNARGNLNEVCDDLKLEELENLE